MKLYDENKINNNKKIANIVLIFIILIFIAIISILLIIITLKNNIFIAKIDGKQNDNLKSLLILEENNSKVYIPIKKIAGFLGYSSYNGDYKEPSEDVSKCYVKSENEVASFSLNSDIIYKIIPNTDSNYEYFQIDEPVKAINGELYTTIDGIEKAFNVAILYNLKQKEFEIYTINHLSTTYSNNVINYGYTGIDEDFNNKKAILDNMLVVKQNEKYGVISSSTGEIILEAKYDKIKYIRQTSDFLVTSNNKVGIMSKEKETKVSLIYDDIELIDYDSNLYIIKKDNKYGIIDINGNIKLYPEYDKIGIDNSNFNDIKNGYVLLDTLIPVKKDNLWGLFDKSGKQIVEFKYTNLGCIQNTSSVSNNLLLIPEYNVIVVNKNNKYNLINLSGNERISTFVDSIYMNVESGNNKYYMLYEGNTLDLSNYLGNNKQNNSSSIDDTINTTKDEINNTAETNNSVMNVNI